MTKVGKYELEGSWTIVARCHYAFARKDGKRYFLKKLLEPKYPSNPEFYEPDMLKRTKKVCADFEKFQEKIIADLNNAAKTCNQIICTLDFFREKSTYYKASEAISGKIYSVEEISKLPESERFAIIKRYATALKSVSDVNIVHGDIKPENIFVVKRGSGFIPLLIDFDDSYYSSAPPKPEFTHGSPEYYSPELAKYISDGEKSKPSTVTCKSDIYASALVIYEWFTGNKLLPKRMADAAYPYMVEAKDLNYKGVPESLRSLLEKMLDSNPSKRPSAEQVIKMMDSIERGETVTATTGDDKIVVRGTKYIATLKGCKYTLFSLDQAKEFANTHKINIYSEKGEMIYDHTKAGSGGGTPDDKGSDLIAKEPDRVEIIDEKWCYIIFNKSIKKALIKDGELFAESHKIPIVGKGVKPPKTDSDVKIEYIAGGTKVKVRTGTSVLTMTVEQYERFKKEGKI